MNLKELLMQAAGMDRKPVPQGQAPFLARNNVQPQRPIQGLGMNPYPSKPIEGLGMNPFQSEAERQLQRNFEPYQLRDYINLADY